jgi:hypothetical protein
VPTGWEGRSEPEDLERRVRQIGLDQVCHFGVKEATERYLVDRSDGLSLPGFFRMLKARVV